MCGINGIISEKSSIRNKIEAMTLASKSRGPDNTGYAINDKVSLSHVLLSITGDKLSSKQPWGDIDKGELVLLYNGEIYNYRQLRSDLKNQEWKTDTDTEVLYHGLKEEGLDFVKKINGMYSIAWYEGTHIHLLRDYAGIKPLYFWNSSDGLHFSSSIKSLLAAGAPRSLNHKAFQIYWYLGHVPGHLTLFDGISKVCPNQVISYNVNTKEIKGRFYTEDITAQQFDQEDFRNRLAKSVVDSTTGHRDMGIFLSGGIDSSVILHELSEVRSDINTFTTRFDCKDKGNKYNDDANVAKKLSKHYGMNHHELNISMKNFIDAMPACVEALEEPRYNISSPAYYLMNQYISHQGITITFSGDGGDEIFTGYPRHNQITRGALAEWFQIVNLAKRDCPRAHRTMILKHMIKWLKQQTIGSDAVNNHLYLECMTHLPEDYLIRNDRLGMNFGMEGRFPLVNREFRNYVLGVPSKHKTNKKIILDAYRGILPDYIIDKKKTGWAIPSVEWKDKVIVSDYWKHVHEDTEFSYLFNRKMFSGKHVWARFYFLAWADQFNITL